ncbi:MAG: S8 family serine peptidase [Bacteroidales bacterium]|nr:S8 family serine peptidase [Bacteroidales bacterium]
MRKFIGLFLAIILSASFMQAQVKVYSDYYAVYFKDKAGTPYSIDKPEQFLSKKSIDRRKKFDIPINKQDLPVSPVYVKKLQDAGFEVIKVSKWLNCAIVKTENIANYTKLSSMDFVINKPEPLAKDYRYKTYKRYKSKEKLEQSKDKYNYGKALTQTQMLNINLLHNEGYTGKGVTIAILDGGFFHVNELPAFKSLWKNGQIKGWYDFVDMDTTVFDEGTHGMMVLSTIGGNTEQLVGTAPDADFWLFVTEDGDSEYPIEEYNYVIAAEMADSIGVDIIHSSLGYADFDDKSLSYKYEDLNGNTAVSTIGADIASSKGILVVTSAGNEGNDPWRYVSAPADADSILAVGAVNFKGKYGSFSSQGPSYDNRIKPEVCAQGVSATVQLSNGRIGTANGTSFSGPIMAGAVACLVQAFPDKSNMEIIEAVIRNSSQAKSPDEKLGYGIPDFYKAFKYLEKR